MHDTQPFLKYAHPTVMTISLQSIQSDNGSFRLQVIKSYNQSQSFHESTLDIFHKAGYAFFTTVIVNIAERMFSSTVNGGCLVKPMGDTKDWWWVKVVDAP